MQAQRELPFWHDLPEIDEPDQHYLATLEARNRRLMAALQMPEAEALVEYDAVMAEMWLHQLDTEYDVTQEVA